MMWRSLIVLLAAGSVEAATVTVPLDAPTIQEAIAACISGDTVRIEPGIYQGPSNRNLDTQGRILTFIGRDYPVLDAQYQGRCVSTGSNSQIGLQGMVFVRGQVNWGGGIWIRGGEAWIEDCAFGSNRAAYGGGLLFDSCALEATRCVFSGNFGGYAGAAIYGVGIGHADVTRSILSNNGPGPAAEAAFGSAIILDCSDLHASELGEGVLTSACFDLAPGYCDSLIWDFTLPAKSSVRRTPCGPVGLHGICELPTDVPIPAWTTSWSTLKVRW